MTPRYFYPCKLSYPPFYPYCNYYYSPHNTYRQYQNVDPGMFMTSAKDMAIIMKEASHLLAEMAKSKKFSFDLMTAAQQSKMEKVEQLIKSTGIKVIPKVTYTPDGLNLHFDSGKDYNDCCKLTLKLRWS
ncbi:hypothetical protein AN957_22465 [Cytobacillus solani]|uniref:Uncharacterized protein n=2 Tax=Cytobacillus solani TaxID=1637975 RepID=A0A0Q3VJ26_9BACI|nr:hypothetical protein AMS60_17140 [Bacillus sp. FJAT-21945]KQL21058.1 hypothetical protein AN957_22465 [Cytobacillus solani]